jgi:hypothetical protein
MSALDEGTKHWEGASAAVEQWAGDPESYENVMQIHWVPVQCGLTRLGMKGWSMNVTLLYGHANKSVDSYQAAIKNKGSGAKELLSIP